MTTQNRIKTVLTIVAVAILALAIGQVQAVAIDVPNGDFAMYKPGTEIPVVSWGPEGYQIWVQQIGLNRPLSGGVGDPQVPGYVTFDDTTTGTDVDVPGWITPLTLPLWRDTSDPLDDVLDDFTTGTAQLFQPSEVPDGTSALNCFGQWSSQNGNLAESAESLGNLAANSAYTLSARCNGNARPLTFELRAGGVAMTPSFSVDPARQPFPNGSIIGGWAVISRTYLAKDITAYVGQPMTIVVGTTPPHISSDPDGPDNILGTPDDVIYPDTLLGQRGKFDNITLDVEDDDPTFPDVDVGPDMISWSGQAVTLDPNVVNNDTEPQGDLTYLWTAVPDGIGDPNLDVAITGATSEEASVTITKAEPTGDATVITMTLAVTLEGKDPVKDTMTIDVYDDACEAAKTLGTADIDPTDFDENCITAFPDFALMAATWLDDYTLTDPAPK